MVKNLPAMWETQIGSLGHKIPWRREELPTPVFLAEFHEQRRLTGYSPGGCKDSDTTEQVTNTHTHSSQGTPGHGVGVGPQEADSSSHEQKQQPHL